MIKTFTPIEVSCPECGAKAGEPCHRWVKTERFDMVNLHVWRRAHAKDVEEATNRFGKLIAETPKRERTRLARAEMWMQLAMVAGEMAKYTLSDDLEDEFSNIARRYGLAEADMTRIMESIAEQCETRAMQSSYDECWGDWAVE